MAAQILASNPKEAQRLLDEHGQRGWMLVIERYGKTFHHAGTVATCDPRFVRALLMDRPHVETRPPVYRLLSMFPGASGVLFMDGEKWLTRARALAPVFHRQNVASAAAMVHTAAASHAARWAGAGRGPDLYASIQQLGAETVLEMGFGFDPADPLARDLAAALIVYKNRSMDMRPSLRIDKLNWDAATIARVPQGMFRMWRDHSRVRRALAAALAGGRRVDGLDWIGRLEEAGLTERELGNEVNHLYGAFNAIDYVITCALWELGSRPELVRTIRAELKAALGERDVPTPDDQKRMPTFDGFILEILRRYPVALSSARVLGAPFELDGHTFPAGTQVLFLMYALHHHPEFWDDPWEIKPERWVSREPRVPFSYVPFLFGARKCAGRDMAEQQMLIVLSAIVRRYDIAVHADAVIPPFMIPRFAAPIPFTLAAA